MRASKLEEGTKRTSEQGTRENICDKRAVAFREHEMVVSINKLGSRRKKQAQSEQNGGENS
jgi:hypothetical protein